MHSLLIVLSIVAQNDLPKEIPNAPTSAPAGTLVILDSSIIPASSRSWLLVNPPLDDNHLVLEDGRLIFSTGQSGKYQFVLAFSPEGEMKPVLIHQILHTLTITGGVNPDPNPRPDPVLPDGKYKFSALARNEALRLKLPQPGRVALIYRGIAREIASGALSSESGKFGQAINKATGEALVKSLTPEMMLTWKPWGVTIGTKLNQLQKDKLLTTDSDYLVAYNEIALGLESLPKDNDEIIPNPTQKVSWIIVVEETAYRTPEVSKVLSDLTFWNGLGVNWRHYDDDSENAQEYLKEIDKLPGVLFLGNGGEVLKSFPLPRTTRELESELKKQGI